MDFRTNNVIEEYLTEQLDIFTVDEFCRYLKSQGVKVTKADSKEILQVSDYTFSLVNNEYVTKAGVFTGRWFSFKPSREEVEKGYIIIGHRCIPFMNSDVPPDSISIMSDGQMIESEAKVFSMNLAMDTFALYGEGYILPYIFNDKNNKTLALSSVQYSMPQEIQLTCWPLNKIADAENFKYGDRILCRVISWSEGIVEMRALHSVLSDMVISDEAVQREEWYTYFENGLLESFDRHGPASSIEEQLSYLFLENQEELCVRSCGSTEEFLAHTSKIGFEPYGVESRIWRTGETVPYIGPWNEDYSSKALFSEMSMIFSTEIVNCYLKNRIYEAQKLKKEQSLEELCHKVFPPAFKMTAAEFKLLLLNIEKSNAIISESYNQFAEYKIAPVRNRVVNLFSEIVSLLCAIGNSGLKLKIFPQQELVILTQLFAHSYKIIEDMEDIYSAEHFPVEDISLSLEGMEETFDDVGEILRQSLEVNTYNNIKIVD